MNGQLKNFKATVFTADDNNEDYVILEPTCVKQGKDIVTLDINKYNVLPDGAIVYNLTSGVY